jgi:dipeptidyl-peptidase-3
MKKALLCSGLLISLQAQALNDPPNTIALHGEIATTYRTDLAELFNDLTPQERVMIYYLYRASIPGNAICTDQMHRDALAITDLCESVLVNKDMLKQTDVSFDLHNFMQQLETYLVYLWSNHGQYFMREHVDEKRTPASIGLDLLNQENLCKVLDLLGYPNPCTQVEKLALSMFDEKVESTASVPGSIEKSAMNTYSPDFTEADFQALSLEQQSHSNSYCYVAYEDGKRVPKVMPCKVGGKYDEELSICLHWLEKAAAHARSYPAQFDQYFAQSLELFCDFLKSGDEEVFKKHSIAWLKSNSRIDYNLGFAESYLDPKAYRGLFQAEITIKSIDMQKVNAMLPQLEAVLPFPAEFKRDNLLEGGATCPNASINTKVFSAGHLGPQNIILAYCLPNYEEIRAEHGSKQIIYAAEKNIGQKINPELYEKLFSLPKDRAWNQQYDPEGKLRNAIFMLHVILHETLGHGSGKSTEHIFVEGDPMTIDGKTYKVGDRIRVTSSNEQIFLGGYSAALEELRAEIIALLSSTQNLDSLIEAGLLGEIPAGVSKEKLLELLIQDISDFTLGKWMSIPEGSTKVTGAHALADTTILYYLLDHGGITLEKDEIQIDGQHHTVLGAPVVSLPKALNAIKELAIKVQAIKSTADRVGVNELFDTYGAHVRNPEHIEILKKNREAVNGTVKMSASIFPYFNQVTNKNGEVVDCTARWPQSFTEQQLEQKHILKRKMQP